MGGAGRPCLPRDAARCHRRLAPAAQAGILRRGKTSPQAPARSGCDIEWRERRLIRSFLNRRRPAMRILLTDHCKVFVAKRFLIAASAILSMCAVADSGLLMGDEWNGPRRNLTLIDCDQSNAMTLDGSDTLFPRRPDAFISAAVDAIPLLKSAV